MGKRSDFPRRPRDTYDTPAEAVTPLLRFLPPATRFAEPCAGAGQLMDHLEAAGHKCVGAWDIEPRRYDIETADALTTDVPVEASHVITNPPWTRAILHPLIAHLASYRPTWVLIDANWLFTKQAAPLLSICQTVVTIGRVKWIPDSKMTGKDDAIWALFDLRSAGSTEFHGRATHG